MATDLFRETVVKAIEQAIIKEAQKIGEEMKKEAVKKLEAEIDKTIAAVGINVAKWVDYQSMSDRVVITLHKEK